MVGRKKGVRKQWSRLFGMVAMGAVLVSGCGSQAVEESVVKQNTKVSNTTAEEVMEEDSKFLCTVSTTDLQATLKDTEVDGGSALVYVGRDTCSHCREYKPIQDKVLKELGMTLSYYDTAKARETNEEEFLAMLETLGVDSVPTLLRIKDGKVDKVMQTEGYLDTTGQTLKEWLVANR